MSKLNKISTLAFSLLFPLLGISQSEAGSGSETYFSNALFNTLLGIIILLLIIIISFSTVLKNVANSDYLDQKLKKDRGQNSSTGKVISTALFILMSFSVMAQNNGSNNWTIGGIDQFTFYFMFSIIFIEILVLGLLIYQFKYLLRTKAEREQIYSREESPILQSLTGAVPVEDEESILLDHDYDGIKELDNDLPPWWKYGFYLTIIIAVIYMYNYHISGNGDLQVAEYDKAMAVAKAEVEEYMRNSANMVDESSVKITRDTKELAQGKDAFISFCAACHGKLGEGGVGPNLTDEYWVHGGSIQDIFKTIKYGWAEKGMKSWKEDLSPMQIAQVSSFILSLKGTNPPNGKAAQGDLYIEKVISDSTAVANDSLNVTLKPDSLIKSSEK